MSCFSNKTFCVELLAKMQAEVDTLRLLAQPKEGQQQFKNKKQPELTENRTAWKSDTKEIKKKHSSRPVGGVEMGSRGREDSRQGSGWQTQRGGGLWNRAGSATAHRPLGPTFMRRKTRRKGGGAKQSAQPRAPAPGNKASNL